MQHESRHCSRCFTCSSPLHQMKLICSQRRWRLLFCLVSLALLLCISASSWSPLWVDSAASAGAVWLPLHAPFLASNFTAATAGNHTLPDLQAHYRELEDRMKRHFMYQFDRQKLLPLMQLNKADENRDFRVLSGLAWMRSQSLVIATTVRDAMRGMPDSLKNLNRLRALFGRSWIVVVESDSEDATRAFLHNLTLRDPSVLLLGCGRLNSRLPCRPEARYRSSGKRHRPGWHVKRTPSEEVERGLIMSALRNQYLTYAYDHLVPLGASLLLVIDADMTWMKWDSDSIAQGLHHFMAKPALQQLCAHTCYANRLHLQDPCTLTFFNNKHFGEERYHSVNYDQSIRRGPKDLPPVKVSSCFQSFAFYRLADLAAARMLYERAPGEWICEHNSLSRQLSEVYFDVQMRLDIDQAYIG